MIVFKESGGIKYPNSDVIAAREKAGQADKLREGILRHDDPASWNTANPVKADGSVEFDDKVTGRREDAQVAAILRHCGFVVVVLGGGHGLRTTSSERESRSSTSGCRCQRTSRSRVHRTASDETSSSIMS
jgi:hypothetical protein